MITVETLQQGLPVDTPVEVVLHRKVCDQLKANVPHLLRWKQVYSPNHWIAVFEDNKNRPFNIFLEDIKSITLLTRTAILS